MATPELPPVVLYDTMIASKRPLSLREPGKCGIYCCGPTVYDMSHVGHARAAVVPDVLVRYLRARGIEVRYVRNITDVDDKIIARALESGTDPKAVATKFTDEYHRDLDALGIARPDIEPRVTDHMVDIIAMIEGLIARELAYVVEGDVYYAVRAFAGYGRLSKRKLEDMEAGARVEVDPRKRDPADFALWKAAKPGEPAWSSPWGEGRPGWHIECSAMSAKHLGETFDIHAGGRDLIFPHHENEIAQSCGSFGDGSFAQHWIHNGFVNFAGEKMSKSLGNFFTIREVTELYHPEVLRYFLLSVHYRSGVNFDVEVTCPACGHSLPVEEQTQGICGACGRTDTVEVWRHRVRFPGLEEADDRVAYIYETLARCDAALGDPTEDALPDPLPLIARMSADVHAGMADDLNTAAALATLSDPLATINGILDKPKTVEARVREATLHTFSASIREFAQALGCFERPPEDYLAERRELKAKRLGLDVERVEALLRERTAARASKDWARADAVRDELAGLGVKIRDSAGQSTWTL